MKKIEDYNEKVSFHPSLDIQNNTLVLGFRVRNSDGIEKNIYVVRNEDSLFTVDNPLFSIGDEKLSINEKARTLARLSQKWSAEGLGKCFDLFNNPTIKTEPDIRPFEHIYDILKRHIELEVETDYLIVVAWIIGTYFFPVFGAYPYLHIKAPKGSGKSQILKLIEQTAFNAVKARASMPALRDTVDSLRGTFIMDQADILDDKKENMHDLLDILTDSYKRGGGMIRKMVKTKADWVVMEFEAYGPKAFGSIKQLPEDLRDRSIEIPLFKSDKSYPSISEEDTLWRQVRDALYTFLINNFNFVSSIYFIKNAEHKKSGDMIGRKLELWLPIETILSVAYRSPDEIKAAQERFMGRYEFAKFEASELEGGVMSAIMELMGNETETVLMPQEIVKHIDPELFANEKNNWSLSLKQKSSLVGRIIMKYNLSSEKLKRISRGERYRFTREKMQKIFSGYFTPDEDDVMAVNEEKDTPAYTEENNISF